MKQAENKSEWLTVGEVADELRVSKNLLYRLIERGEIEVVDLGPHSKRITRGALDAFLSRRRSSQTLK